MKNKPRIVQLPKTGDSTAFRVYWPLSGHITTYLVTGVLQAMTGKTPVRLLSEGRALMVDAQ